jgi:hypothetical protein
MEINSQGGYKLPTALPSARSADKPVVTKTIDHSTGSVPAPKAPDLMASAADAVEQKRLEHLMQAAQHLFKDVYAVSDTTFTIYKDATGQYITRFHSLEDGTVTYIPEPQLLQYTRQGSPESFVAIEA